MTEMEIQENNWESLEMVYDDRIEGGLVLRLVKEKVMQKEKEDEMMAEYG